ncbi:hypothetical protein EJ04DRAFT_76627 [Polyplosphaeria fusca]|uniref:Uncharacterized protein n=1 Tax=Polyplosphaeria fusca TaxID=682080 RepID=A0A9P4UUT4_9PLEO|nr:hypothetical protein EJ04DRAFT_76627 [Polyplosphaeria fusca]
MPAIAALAGSLWLHCLVESDLLRQEVVLHVLRMLQIKLDTGQEAHTSVQVVVPLGIADDLVMALTLLSYANHRTFLLRDAELEVFSKLSL